MIQCKLGCFPLEILLVRKLSQKANVSDPMQHASLWELMNLMEILVYNIDQEE